MITFLLERLEKHISCGFSFWLCTIKCVREIPTAYCSTLQTSGQRFYCTQSISRLQQGHQTGLPVVETAPQQIRYLLRFINFHIVLLLSVCQCIYYAGTPNKTTINCQVIFPSFSIDFCFVSEAYLQSNRVYSVEIPRLYCNKSLRCADHVCLWSKISNHRFKTYITAIRTRSCYLKAICLKSAASEGRMAQCAPAYQLTRHV